MLIDIYSKSDIVILGGGFLDGIGGHNPVEPASFNNKIISGKYMFNQKEILKFIENIQLVKIDEIYQALKNSELLENSKITQNIDLNKIIDKIII
jgi:3-deoxy-D-manno-octulosonic-acid transferase